MDIKALRERHGLSPADLADELGVHWRSVHRWEHDQVAPSPLAAARLAEFAKTGPQRVRAEAPEVHAAPPTPTPAPARVAPSIPSRYRV